MMRMLSTLLMSVTTLTSSLLLADWHHKADDGEKVK
jgi:hypothetical protein